MNKGSQVTISTPATSATNPAWVEGTNGPDVTGLAFSAGGAGANNGGESFDTKTINEKNWFAAGDAGSNSGAGSSIVGSPMGIPISATQSLDIIVDSTPPTLIPS